MRRPLPLALAHAVSLAAPILALAAAGCVRRPDWSKNAPGGANGDGTIQGEPMAIPRFASPPNLDGKLDDAVWANAARTASFVAPGDGHEVSDGPVVAFAKLGWDDQKLYVGVVVEDGAPTQPFARDAQDPRLWEQSAAVELMIQPGDFPDNREYFELQVDTAGAVFDTRWDDYNKPIVGGPDEATKKFGHMDWSSSMERAAFVDRRFYAIEFAVPWSALRTSRVPGPPKAGDLFRVNLYSFRDGQRQALAWSPIKGQGNFHRSARWGRVKLAP